MEEPILQFISTWNLAGKIVGVIFLAFAAIKILSHFIKLAAKKEAKEKYDFINKNEISALWTTTLLTIVSICFLANSFIGEIGMFWVIIRGFITLCVSFMVGIVANNMFKFYYPFYIEKRLKKLRYTPRISPETGNTMKLLSEDEEDVYLDDGMQAEEEVFSVDYDVWVDEETGFTKIEKYSGHLHAMKCPECNYQTFKVDREEIITRPTATEEGELVKYISCGYCGHKSQNAFKVAKLQAVEKEVETA